MIDVLAHNHAPDETWVLEWLSSPRLQTYLDASGNNLQRALRLYGWNINLGQTLMKDIAFFEVALRNAYNREIDSRWDGTRHWLFDDDSPVNIPIPRHNRAGQSFDANALNRTSIRNATPSRTETIQPDKTIANLPLKWKVCDRLVRLYGLRTGGCGVANARPVQCVRVERLSGSVMSWYRDVDR